MAAGQQRAPWGHLTGINLSDFCKSSITTNVCYIIIYLQENMLCAMQQLHKLSVNDSEVLKIKVAVCLEF